MKKRNPNNCFIITSYIKAKLMTYPLQNSLSKIALGIYFLQPIKGFK